MVGIYPDITFKTNAFTALKNCTLHSVLTSFPTYFALYLFHKWNKVHYNYNVI